MATKKTDEKSNKPSQLAAVPGEESISLAPTGVPIGDPDLTLIVTGADATFNVRSNIIFNGANTVTELVDASHVSTVITPSTVTTAGPVDVWVWTDGTHDTAPATFTFAPAVTPATTDDTTLTAQLRALGLSGEPVRWAFDQYQAPAVAIRAANTGRSTIATVQGVLNSSFPFNTLKANKICLPYPAQAQATVKTAKDGTTTLDSGLADLELPPEAIVWRVDGDVVATGPSATIIYFPPGEHQVRLDVSVAGETSTDVQTVGEPLPKPKTETARREDNEAAEESAKVTGKDDV